uniref:Transposase n=1 Tax=Heterorhabditis bacteriophora TaxID=37862 RepID=A0A1I7W8Y0_HETBA
MCNPAEVRNRLRWGFGYSRHKSQRTEPTVSLDVIGHALLSRGLCPRALMSRGLCISAQLPHLFREKCGVFLDSSEAFGT